jgi:hypothetical protein
MKKLFFLCVLSSCVSLLAYENLNYLSTEKHNRITASLSTVMHQDCVQGLQLL